jgi:hypothetical protein
MARRDLPTVEQTKSFFSNYIKDVKENTMEHIKDLGLSLIPGSLVYRTNNIFRKHKPDDVFRNFMTTMMVIGDMSLYLPALWYGSETAKTPDTEHIYGTAAILSLAVGGRYGLLRLMKGEDKHLTNKISLSSGEEQITV